jgi:hypothetical protein
MDREPQRIADFGKAAFALKENAGRFSGNAASLACDRRASRKPVNCRWAFIFSSHMSDTRPPSTARSLPDVHSYDSLLENRAGNFHRHLRRICGFPL